MSAVTSISTTRAVERCERLAALGPPPAWWRVFALRRWLSAYDAIMALDISVGAQMLREIYPAESVKAMAKRPSATAALLRMVPRGERRYVGPIEYVDRIADDQARGRAMTSAEMELAAQQLNQRRPR